MTIERRRKEEENPSNKRFDKIEVGFSTEIVGGRQYYRIPYVWGEGSGFGFSIQHVNLPLAWREQADKVKQLSQEVDFLDCFCKYSQDTQAGIVSTIMDSKTGLLVLVAVNGPHGYSALKLAQNDAYKASIGQYVAENINNLEVALVLQKSAAIYLTEVHKVLGTDIDVPYIDKHRNQYNTQNLLFPRKMVEREGIVLSDYGQKLFTQRAHNIAGRFGVDIKDLKYTENGFLEMVTILNGGKATYFSLSPYFYDNYTYNAHNVDNAREVCTLHAIVASFLNDRLKGLDGIKE